MRNGKLYGIDFAINIYVHIFNMNFELLYVLLFYSTVENKHYTFVNKI